MVYVARTAVSYLRTGRGQSDQLLVWVRCSCVFCSAGGGRIVFPPRQESYFGQVNRFVWVSLSIMWASGSTKGNARAQSVFQYLRTCGARHTNVVACLLTKHKHAHPISCLHFCSAVTTPWGGKGVGCTIRNSIYIAHFGIKNLKGRKGQKGRSMLLCLAS